MYQSEKMSYDGDNFGSVVGGVAFKLFITTKRNQIQKGIWAWFFFHKNRKSAKFFDLCVVWPWELVRSKALIQEHLLDTLNIYFWDLENFLEASEVEESIEKWENLKSNFEISRWIFEKSLKNTFFLSFKLMYVFYGHESWCVWMV